MVIYDIISSKNEVEPDQVILKKPLLGAISLDAKIWNGDWPIMGNITKNLSNIPQPTFKVRQHGVIFLESSARKISRPATYVEQQTLRFRNIVAPVRLQNALKAHNGIGIWHTRYDELLFSYVLESSKFDFRERKLQ